jgi:hypothetical protein
MRPAALHVLADAAEAPARLAPKVAFERPEALDDALIPVGEAAPLAATAERVVRCAIRRGDLAADGSVSAETLCNRMLCAPVVLVTPFARRGSVARDVAMKANPGGYQ